MDAQDVNVRLGLSDHSIINEKAGLSDEINIVVYKDTSRQTHGKRSRRCRSSSRNMESSMPNEELTKRSGSSRYHKGSLQMFPCSQCDYEGTRSNLAVHRFRTHNKGYKCSKCEYQSVTEGGVERHERIFHSTEDVRAYACGVCSYRGVTRKQLHEHTKYQHREGVAKHSCPACQKMFKTQVQLKHHILSHSLERLYACKGCSYRAKHRQSLHLHIRHCHPGSEVRALFRGPTDSDFEAIMRSASSGPKSRWSGESVEVGYSPGSDNDSKAETYKGFILKCLHYVQG
ncbi:zinc finger protein 142-like isoform X2 [Ischnura elegans]|uniref:zinc finger protein 142-like isoform X2 n=1 Tax=Ischnura elegans TaxID=197161 RepID=UPI001ED8B40A|nr:zinc finger protein 142-like isoform X2 [Ischnura elegans]